MFNSGQFTALYHEYLESGKLKRQLPPKKGFVPVVFENQQQGGSFQVHSGSKQFSNPASANHTVSCEICYPNGVSMKLSGVPDSQTLRSLLLLPHQ